MVICSSHESQKVMCVIDMQVQRIAKGGQLAKLLPLKQHCVRAWMEHSIVFEASNSIVNTFVCIVSRAVGFMQRTGYPVVDQKRWRSTGNRRRIST